MYTRILCQCVIVFKAVFKTFHSEKFGFFDRILKIVTSSSQVKKFDSHFNFSLFHNIKY